jgi:hypothetical protein
VIPYPSPALGTGGLVESGGTTTPSYSVSVAGQGNSTVTSANAQLASREFSSNIPGASYSIAKDPGDGRISGEMNGSVPNRADFFVNDIGFQEAISVSFVVTASGPGGDTATTRFGVSVFRSS